MYACGKTKVRKTISSIFRSIRPVEFQATTAAAFISPFVCNAQLNARQVYNIPIRPRREDYAAAARSFIFKRFTTTRPSLFQDFPQISKQTRTISSTRYSYEFYDARIYSRYKVTHARTRNTQYYLSRDLEEFHQRSSSSRSTKHIHSSTINHGLKCTYDQFLQSPRAAS